MANTWTNKRCASEDICQLMRDINALQAAVSGWRLVGHVGRPMYISDSAEIGSSIPQQFVTDSNGNLFLCTDTHIDKFDSTGKWVLRWTVPGGRGVAVDSSGNVFVSCADDCKVRKFDNNGGDITSFGQQYPSGGGGSYANGDIAVPRHITCGPSGEVLLADDTLGVTKWDSAGTFQWRYIDIGITTSPEIVVDGVGDSFVRCSAPVHGIQIIDTAGTLQGSFAAHGGDSGVIAFYDGQLYLGESYAGVPVGNTIKVYSTAGVLQNTISLPGGSSEGGVQIEDSFSFADVALLHIDSAGRMFVGSSYNSNSVSIWSEGQSTFYSYGAGTKTSLGVPDGGTSVPALGALNTAEAIVDPSHIIDCRFAVEGLARFFDVGGGAAFNWWSNEVNNTIVAVSNTTPIQIQFSGDDLPYNTWFRVSGVGGCTAANGDWKFINGATPPYTHILEGSSGNGVYTNGGAISNPFNLYTLAMGDRSGYGATQGARRTWTRSYWKNFLVGHNPLLGAAVVVGTDDLYYQCIATHLSDSAKQPITGADWADYWALTHPVRHAAVWLENMGYNTWPYVVQGTDARYFRCINDHIAAAGNRPITGANWADYWKAESGLVSGAVWVNGTEYSSPTLYDIDIGEIRECVDLLAASAIL